MPHEWHLKCEFITISKSRSVSWVNIQPGFLFESILHSDGMTDDWLTKTCCSCSWLDWTSWMDGWLVWLVGWLPGRRMNEWTKNPRKGIYLRSSSSSPEAAKLSLDLKVSSKVDGQACVHFPSPIKKTSETYSEIQIHQHHDYNNQTSMISNHSATTSEIWTDVNHSSVDSPSSEFFYCGLICNNRSSTFPLVCLLYLFASQL